MPTKKAEQRIKQLCFLGLGGQVIMPTLLKELHAVVPSYSNPVSDQLYLVCDHGKIPRSGVKFPIMAMLE